MKPIYFFIAILLGLFARYVDCREYLPATAFYSDLFDESEQSSLCDQEACLTQVEYHTRNDSNIIHIACKEHFLWRYDAVHKKHRLEAKVLEDNQENIICCHAYEYDAEGMLVKIIVAGGHRTGEKGKQGNHLIEIVLSNCKDGKAAGKPEAIEEFDFDEELNQFILVTRVINHYNAHGWLQRQQIDEMATGLSHERIFLYDAWGRVLQIEDTSDKSEEFFYDPNGNCMQIDRTHQGQSVGVKRYTYDHADRLIEIEESDVDDVICVKIFKYHNFSSNEHAVEYPTEEKNPIEEKEGRHHPLDTFEEIPIDTIEDPINAIPGEVPPPQPSGFWNTLYSIKDTCSSWMSQAYDQLRKLKEGLSYSNYAGKKWDEALHGFLGKTFLMLTGYYQHKADSGSFGSGEEVNDKVRITLINGILNVREDLHINLHALSNTHGGATVHYVFRPTGGWMSDLVNCLMVKFGYVSPQAHLLAEKWKELITEMGGTEGGGQIIHYAHSIGGTDTYAAKGLLSPDELKMIQVYTIGSPTMIPSGGFSDVKNYVSKRDGVCLLDPVGYLRGLFKDDSNVVFLGTFWGIPFVEHTMNTQSYHNIMKSLGERFLNLYGLY